jgi:DNA-binding NtrC family response regulator
MISRRGFYMSRVDLLPGKRILVVDDEPDVLNTLEELLDMCDVVKASTFDRAKESLETGSFDMAVLDIMGVSGYFLLGIANAKKVIPVMLTSHALSPEDIVRSYREGAASYVPKDQISKIAIFLRDILEARERGKHFWWRWLQRLGYDYWDRKFGPRWRDADREFWDEFEAKE